MSDHPEDPPEPDIGSAERDPAVPPGVLNENVRFSTNVDETDEGYRVKRTAAFAEVADRPKRTAIDQEQMKNDVVFFDDLRKFDAELAGTIYAQCQSAAAGVDAVHPATEGAKEDMTALEETITEECRDLIDDIGLREDAMTIFRNLVVHGNDVSWVGYEDGEGVVAWDPLPLRCLTILDDRNRDQSSVPFAGNQDRFEDTIQDANWYVINEDNSDVVQYYPKHDILHIGLNRRGNWHVDLKGRDTFNVWGERRLEPVRYTLQAKQNTLANKVAMDDKLLAREFYYINVEDLFGHYDDPDVRHEKAKAYADDLRELIEGLDADQKPVLPEEVSVEIEGPDGETARNMADFIQTMNDSIQHALTYHVASFGRDAGGTDRGNRPAKEMSETTVRNIRDVVRTSFKRLFAVHAMLRHEGAREVVDPEADDISRYELADDVTLPVLTFDPVDPQEEAEKVRNAISLFEKGVATRNEARAVVGLEPTDEDGDEFYTNPGDNDMGDMPGDGPGDGGDEGDGPGDGSGGNRESYPTDS